MPTTIGRNIASLRGQRALNNSSRELANVSERLPSGVRINKASDDAAGLAISESLSAKSRIFTQGIRNINDGVSLFNIADAAVSTVPYNMQHTIAR